MMQHEESPRTCRRRVPSFLLKDDSHMNACKKMRKRISSFRMGSCDDIGVLSGKNERRESFKLDNHLEDHYDFFDDCNIEIFANLFPAESGFDLIPGLGTKRPSFMTGDHSLLLDSNKNQKTENLPSSNLERLESFQEMSLALDSLFNANVNERSKDAPYPAHTWKSSLSELEEADQGSVHIFRESFDLDVFSADKRCSPAKEFFNSDFVQGSISEAIDESISNSDEPKSLNTSPPSKLKLKGESKSIENGDNLALHRRKSGLGGARSFFNRPSPVCDTNSQNSVHSNRQRSPYASTPTPLNGVMCTSVRRGARAKNLKSEKNNNNSVFSYLTQSENDLSPSDFKFADNKTQKERDTKIGSKSDANSNFPQTNTEISIIWEKNCQPRCHDSLTSSWNSNSSSKRQTSEEVAKRLPVNVLEDFYHVPLNTAARELSVSLTMLKKLCRQYGIKRWPHRQVLSLNKSIMKLQSKINNPGGDEKISPPLLSKLESLHKKRQLIVKTASAGLDPDVLNAVFAARPQDIDEDELLRTGDFSNLRTQLAHYLTVSRNSGGARGGSSSKTALNISPEENEYSCEETAGESEVDNIMKNSKKFDDNNRETFSGDFLDNAFEFDLGISTMPADMNESFDESLNFISSTSMLNKSSAQYTNQALSGNLSSHNIFQKASKNDLLSPPMLKLSFDSPNSTFQMLNLDPNVWQKSSKYDYISGGVYQKSGGTHELGPPVVQFPPIFPLEPDLDEVVPDLNSSFFNSNSFGVSSQTSLKYIEK